MPFGPRLFGNRAAEGLHPDESCSRIESAARAALANRADVHPAIFAVLAASA